MLVVVAKLQYSWGWSPESKGAPTPSSSQRRRCPLEGVPLAELGRGHQKLSSAGQGQGAHLNCQCYLMLFLTSIYSEAIALLQPSNILLQVCIQLLCNSNAAKEARPGLTGRLRAVTAATGKQTLKAVKHQRRTQLN